MTRVRTLFATTLLIIAVGLAYFTALGLTQR
ncbi:hypothetical protein RKD49_006302 [Streptomyces glaucescens]